MQSGQGQMSTKRAAESLPQVRVEKACRWQLGTLTGPRLDVLKPRENAYHEQAHERAEEEESCMS